MQPHLSDCQSVPVKHIVCLPEMQPRADGFHIPTLRRYREAMEAGDEFPPILLARFEGALVLVDGWHRLEAQRQLGCLWVLSEVREAESRAEAKLWAFEANRKHGLPLKRSEQKEMLRTYFKAGRHRRTGSRRIKSYREMAEELGIPKTTLATWTAEIAPSIAKALSEGRPARSGSRGGARERGPGRRLAQEARRALEDAQAAIAGVTDPTERWRLLEQVKGMERDLALGDLQEPMF